MSDNQGQSEPSMEEILASIRRIISEEDGDEAKPAADSRTDEEAGDRDGGDDGGSEGDDEDVLELTEMDAVPDEEPPMAEAEGEEEPLGPGEADVFAGEPEEPEPAEAAAPRAAAAEAAVAEREVADEEEAEVDDGAREGLVSASTAAATTAALSELTRRRRVPAASYGTPSGGETLESFVARQLEPHLREWLDENLQPLVERVVRDEVRRLARRAEDD